MSPVRRLWPALALLFAIGPAASAQTTEAADAVTAALRAGNFAQAVERSQAALARAPNDARLGKGVDVQVRFEVYNIFNRKNLYLSNDLSSPGFGKAISQQLPRWWQFGARLTF